MNTNGHYKDLGFDLSLAGVSHGEFAFKAFVNPITAAPSSDQTAKLDQFSIPFQPQPAPKHITIKLKTSCGVRFIVKELSLT